MIPELSPAIVLNDCQMPTPLYLLQSVPKSFTLSSPIMLLKIIGKDLANKPVCCYSLVSCFRGAFLTDLVSFSDFPKKPPNSSLVSDSLNYAWATNPGPHAGAEHSMRETRDIYTGTK